MNNVMTKFTLQLAECTVSVTVLYEATKRYCNNFILDTEICEKTAEISTWVSQRDIEYERYKISRQDALEGIPPRTFTDEYLEVTAVQRKICEKLVDYDTILMHGSVVAVDGEAYLFTAKSGTGKSTHTRHWRELFGQRAVMVNDDKPLLKLTEEGILACGTPWNGKHGLGSNIMVPLKAICILERGETNEIHPISPQEALPMVLQQTHRPKNLAKYLEILDKLTQRVSFYHLKCTNSPEAAQAAYAGMQESPNE